MDRQKKSVRILLVGDAGCGKTSLILTLVSEEFPTNVPNRSEIITIPADVTPEGVLTHIVDYCEEEQNEEELANEISKADVICLIYSADDENSLIHITDIWLPLFRSINSDSYRPVILVANKSDLLEVPGATVPATFKISENFPEVATCIECSAKNVSNVSEMFYFAQKAFLYPIEPLYDPKSKQLKPACVRALKRIFRMFDLDKDNIHSDIEISDFQKICFKKPLDRKGLHEFKAIVKQNTPDGLTPKGITFNGFKFIQQLFIQRGRQETTWLVLRKFGYDDQLNLLLEKFCPLQLLNEDDVANVDLSQSAIDFLTELFHQFDMDHDSALNKSELNEVFSVFPENPINEESLEFLSTNSNGFLTLDGWISFFVTQTKMDYQSTLMYLAYLGFGGTDISTCSTSLTILPRVNNHEFRSKQSLSFYTCFVCGPPLSGKSSFLKQFIDKQTLNSLSDENTFINTVNNYGIVSKCFRSSNSQRIRHLILKEVEWSETDYSMRNGIYDCLCFLYSSNDPGSFDMIDSYVLDAISMKIPVVIIKTMADLPDQTNSSSKIAMLSDIAGANILNLDWSYSKNFNEKSIKYAYEQLFSFVVDNEVSKGWKQTLMKIINGSKKINYIGLSGLVLSTLFISWTLIRLKKYIF